MRKIRRPNLIVKPREIFYFLKRQKALDSLTEEIIADILLKEKPSGLVDPACLYDHWTDAELAALDLADKTRGRTLTSVIATVGDRGLEALLARLAGGPKDLEQRRTLWAWAEALLAKLSDFTSGLIQEEASVESLELGLARTLDLAKDRHVVDLVWTRLSPESKIGVRRVEDAPGSAPRFAPAFSRVWIIPWISKKEKKQLTAQNSG
ncbi:MAG: hypothetical protein AAB091_06570 [Elusimicrobiota bacterium]